MLEIKIRLIEHPDALVLEAFAESRKCQTLWNYGASPFQNFAACAKAWLRGQGYQPDVKFETHIKSDHFVFVPERLSKVDTPT